MSLTQNEIQKLKEALVELDIGITRFTRFKMTRLPS